MRPRLREINRVKKKNGFISVEILFQDAIHEYILLIMPAQQNWVEMIFSEEICNNKVGGPRLKSTKWLSKKVPVKKSDSKNRGSW